jgi:hypothetical protein
MRVLLSGYFSSLRSFEMTALVFRGFLLAALVRNDSVGVSGDFSSLRSFEMTALVFRGFLLATLIRNNSVGVQGISPRCARSK